MANILRRYAPGILLSMLIGWAAIAITQIFALPVMMLALLFGLCFHSICERPLIKDGVNWASRVLLYIGVALLGLRIDVTDLSQAGLFPIAFIALTLIATLAFGFMVSRAMGENKQFGLLMSGAVAICGVSAAAAICSAMEDCETRDRELTITIAGITGLSTTAMLLYPAVSHFLELTPAASGLFMGGSIHNVSQAVGAGYSISNEAGDMTVIFKLLRVSALLPIIVLISIFSGTLSNMQNPSSVKKIGSYFPPFLMAFIGLAILSCLQLVPETITTLGNSAAKFCLIVSLVAIGIKTDLQDVFSHGKKPLVVMTLITAFMACFILAGIYLLPQI